MKTRTHFSYRIDMLDSNDEIVEHLAGDDYEVAKATWEAAARRWPKEIIILHQGARVVRDSRRLKVVK
jgi:hypothetical protein